MCTALSGQVWSAEEPRPLNTIYRPDCRCGRSRWSVTGLLAAEGSGQDEENYNFDASSHFKALAEDCSCTKDAFKEAEEEMRTAQ